MSPSLPTYTQRQEPPHCLSGRQAHHALSQSCDSPPVGRNTLQNLHHRRRQISEYNLQCEGILPSGIRGKFFDIR